MTGGMACGFVIEIPDHDLRIYHAGDTNMFSDMKIINDLYKPDIAMLPISDVEGMGPMEAAYCAKNFLPDVKKIIPMGFGTIKEFTGTPEAFEDQCKEMGVTATIVRPQTFAGGAAVKQDEKED